MDNPPWASEFKRLLNAGEDGFHETEVAQCWHTEPFVKIYLPLLPAWIRRSLFGRSTYGYVHGVEGLDPHEAMTRLMASEQKRERRDWTVNLVTVEERLVTDLSPTSFEYLTTALLQLEHPEESWQNVGGSGDDGIDGIASDDMGNVCALLQCKWQYWGQPLDLTERWDSVEAQPRMILASLLHPDPITHIKNIEFMGRRRTAELVVKHVARLSQAISMRIGNGP